MAAVRAMQVSLYHVVDVIPMRDPWMPAGRTVNMVCAMLGTFMFWGAAPRVGRGDRKYMLVHMIPVDMVQMAIMHIIDMIVMLHGCMPAARAMPVLVSLVHVATRLSHFASFSIMN